MRIQKMTAGPRFDLRRGWSPSLGWRGFRELLFALPLYQVTLAGGAPDAVRGTPPDSWPSDKEAAAALIDGEFLFMGRRIVLGAAPWSAIEASPEAAQRMHRFGWLRDLRAVATNAARQSARDLVSAWIETHGRWSPRAWQADVIGERFVNLLTSFTFLAHDGGADFAARVLATLARQLRHLARAAASAPGDARVLRAAKGLIYGGACLPGREACLEAGLALLERELDRQILPDGGHTQRNPSLQLDVLRDLIDVRATLVSASVEVPFSLQSAIDRTMPMIRTLRHGDGRFALFNGGIEGDDRIVNVALAHTGSTGSALMSAPHSGFNRLAAGRVVIIADVGAPPAPGSDELAHAGTLSFEMSVGKERLIVNCGGRAHGNGPWRDALRATAAHSTLVVDETNSCELLAEGGLGRRPSDVIAARREVDGNLLIAASHDGYTRPFALEHKRTIYLAPDGSDVRGEDALIGSGGNAFAARFHLHPDVKASLAEDAGSVLLKLRSGAGWRFRASGGGLALEDSIYSAGDGEIRRTRQIVVAGALSGQGALVKWRLGREGSRR
jgi:uncharacterized heparinase superfamily protein